MVRRSVVLGFAVLMSVAGCAYAQTINAKFDIPFKFNVGKSVMPAGAYYVETATAQSDSGMLLIRRQDRRRGGSFLSANAVLNPRAAQDKTELIFHCYSGRCFLSQVWTAGSEVGRQVVVSRQEHLLARQGPGLRVPVFAAMR